MTETKIADLIGLTELAEVLGVSKNEANALRQRHGFPAPVHKLRMGPMWDKQQITDWITDDFRPGGRHVLNQEMKCIHCGGPVFFTGRPLTEAGVLITLHLSCYQKCPETLLRIGHGSELQALIQTSKEDA